MFMLISQCLCCYQITCRSARDIMEKVIITKMQVSEGFFNVFSFKLRTQTIMLI